MVRGLSLAADREVSSFYKVHLFRLWFRHPVWNERVWIFVFHQAPQVKTKWNTRNKRTLPLSPLFPLCYRVKAAASNQSLVLSAVPGLSLQAGSARLSAAHCPLLPPTQYLQQSEGGGSEPGRRTHRIRGKLVFVFSRWCFPCSSWKGTFLMAITYKPKLQWFISNLFKTLSPLFQAVQ